MLHNTAFRVIMGTDKMSFLSRYVFETRPMPTLNRRQFSAAAAAATASLSRVSYDPTNNWESVLQVSTVAAVNTSGDSIKTQELLSHIVDIDEEVGRKRDWSQDAGQGT